MTSELEQAVRAYRRAEKGLEQRRDELADLVVRASNEGVPQVELTRVTGWSREHIRKLVKAANEKARKG